MVTSMSAADNSAAALNIDGGNPGVAVNINNGNINYVFQPDPVTWTNTLSRIISSLTKVRTGNGIKPPQWKEFKIEEKISFNSVLTYRFVIASHSLYYTKCDELLDIEDNSDCGKKYDVLSWIEDRYLEEKGRLIPRDCTDESTIQSIINAHADDIISNVKNAIKKFVITSPEVCQLDEEDIDNGVTSIACYAFMQCKILENPNDNKS